MYLNRLIILSKINAIRVVQSQKLWFIWPESEDLRISSNLAVEPFLLIFFGHVGWQLGQCANIVLIMNCGHENQIENVSLESRKTGRWTSTHQWF